MVARVAEVSPRPEATIINALPPFAPIRSCGDDAVRDSGDLPVSCGLCLPYGEADHRQNACARSVHGL